MFFERCFARYCEALFIFVKTKSVMKSIVLLLAMCAFGLTASAQKIYSVDAEYKAQVKVYVVDAEYKADLVVYKENAEYKAGNNDGRWYFRC